MGGSYVGSTQDSILNLIQELNLDTYLVEDTQEVAYLRASDDDDGYKSSRREFRACTRPDGEPNFGGFLQWLDYVNMVRLIDNYGSQIPSNAPWLAPKAREWDGKTFKQFVDENTWTKTVRDYFNNLYTQIDVCCEANEVSMLWLLWYIKQCGCYGRTIATTNGGQERKVVGGTQQISQRLASMLGPNRVFLNKPVYRIQQNSTSTTVTCLDGTQIQAEYLIMSIPPHLWLKIHYEPSLADCKNQLAQRSPMGTVGKIILYYERPFWREHNLSGMMLNESGLRKSYPVILTLDDTKPDGSYPAIIGFMGARGWYEMRKKGNDEVAAIVAKAYARTTGIEEFLRYKRFERGNWCNEQYSGGCYTTTHAPNTLTKYGPNLREVFGRIHYAGTETAIKWSGYMDGAVSAGKRSAREILHRMGLIGSNEIWQIEPQASIIPPRPFNYPASYQWTPSVGSLLTTGVGLLAISSAAVVIVCFLINKRPTTLK